jgi:exopolysaccharide biosynthesis protein
VFLEDADPPVGKPGKRRWLRILLSSLAVVLLVAAAAAWWALDRFVIDHVEIADVAAYEASVIGDSGSAAPTVDATGSATDDETASAADSTTVDDTTSADPSADAAVVTATSYSDENTTIEISQVAAGTGRSTVTYYVADVTLTDATDLKAGFANNAFGTNIVEYTSDIAEYYDGIFAINGDYYGFRETGIVIRNGVIFRDDGARVGLAIYTDGSMEIYDETTTSADELVAAGVYNTLSFGPALVDDGEIVDGIDNIEIDTNFGNHSIQGAQPRTGIGVIDDNHFVFVVVDGRSAGYSRGVTMSEFAEIFVDLGATGAYNLDGGGSSTMYFNGDLVNNPLGNGEERGTSDILYIAVGEEAA